jgi:hypothetical protein
MDEKTKAPRITTILLAVILWLVSFGLGLETIYNLKEICLYVSVLLGSSVQEATTFALILAYILGLAYMIFIIASTEYHTKHVGKPESWRLFGWTLAVEISIYILHIIL